MWKTSLLIVFTFSLSPLLAGNWPGFRGPTANGIAQDTEVPLQWSDTENLAWKLPLPGPGSSSPIVWGDRIFLICYSGYGIEKSKGKTEDLKRHLLCINRLTGKVLWDKTFDAVQPEDRYSGFISEHGYASSTPVTDGKHLYIFLGKSGVFAFDLNGKQIWQKSVGTESSNRRWGSAASPILYQDLLIVNASEESVTLFAFNKKDGSEAWKVQSPKLELTYGTPTIARTPNGQGELVIAVPQEVWGFDPLKGTTLWWAHMDLPGNISPSLIAGNGSVFVTGGRPDGSLVLRTGGRDDVTKTHITWTSEEGSYIPSAVLLGKHLYYVNHKAYAHCVEAKTGKIIYKEKLPAKGNNAFYASVVLVADRLYAVSRQSGTFVLAAKPEFQQLAHNQLTDDTDFNGSPAVCNGQILIRSNTTLYCIAANDS